MTSIKYKFGLLFGILLVSFNFGSSQWVDPPITCYTCEGEECTSSSLGVFKVCQGSDSRSQACLTVFGDSSDSNVISRGCINDVEKTHAEYCESNSDKCVSCLSSGCNRAKALSEYVECLSCDSETDKNCVLNPSSITSTRLCYESCMVALYARDASDSNSAYELSRSCLDDKDLDSRTECSQGEDEFCKACAGPKCNDELLPENRHKCIQCTLGEDCEDASTETCVSYASDDQCYFLFDDAKDVVRMGCRSEFDQEALVAQISDQKLVLCDGINCNDFSNMPQPKKCNKCDSETDPECLQDPATLEKETLCAFPYTQCYSKVSDTNAGVTVRGCLNELEGAEFYECLMNGNKNCQSCNEAQCNQQIVPSDRIQCQRCSSDNSDNCHSYPSALSLCPLFSEPETCVTVYKDGVTTRGCGSELTCDPSNLKSCDICSSTGCNTVSLKKKSEESYGIFQELPLTCYTCTDDECEQALVDAKTCEGNAQQDCMTIFSSDGEVVSRGCEDSLVAAQSSICDANPELCFKCKSNNCNTITDPSDYVECIYCDTANDPNCVQDLSKISASRKCSKGCLTALYPASSDPSIKELIRSCVDDIEAEDVDNCSNDSNCAKCEGAKCNDQVLPETRLSCNTCLAEDCPEPTEKLCSIYTETDQCFMLFNEVSDIVRMGCKSELTPTELSEHIKVLFTCDGHNCNNIGNLPTPNVCAICNSLSDPLCATNPEGSLTLTECNALPNRQCYTRVASGGSTSRGCLQSLAVKEFAECLEGSSCEICVGDSCNKEVYPADRTVCHRCSSLDNDDCEYLPSASGVCPLYVEGDTCVTKAVNGITSRGCGSELSCGTLGRKNCWQCSGNNCNTVDLIGEDVGVPGLWQEPPLTCYTCDGEDCATSKGLLRVCVGNQLQTCATVFGQEGNVVARGCSDSVEASYAEYCGANPGQCLECKSAGCNSAFSMSEYIDCIFCDAKTNPDCTLNASGIRRTRKCLNSCMTALYPRTSDANPPYDLVRTCLDDKNLDDRESCGTDSMCKSCAEDGCNTDLIPEVRATCYQCSGDECQAPTASSCLSYSTDEQCYALYDETNSLYRLGCKSDYDPQDINAFLLQRKLYLCNGDNCNHIDQLPETRRCMICNSRTDSSCATNPEILNVNTACNRLPMTDCYTRILDDGHTDRGCLSSLEGDEFLDCYNGESSKCAICADGLCNSHLFPEDRLSCQICDSSTYLNCESNPQRPTVCLKYSSDQKCVSTLKDDVTYRGCSEQLSCEDICQTCNTSDCNVHNVRRLQGVDPGVWQDLPLNCYWCSDDGCTTSKGLLNVCSGNDQQHCVTVFGEAGTVIRRGCSDAVEEQYASYCDASSENCYNCNSNGCNNAFSLDDYIDCIYCDSSLDKNCVLDVSAVGKTRRCQKECMVALRPRSANQSSVYELVRSCLDDKDLDDRDICGRDGSNCTSCASGKCNTGDIVENRLQCYSCLGDNCEEPQSEICVSYEEDASCFILFDAENSVSRMGCLSEFTDEELTSNLPKLISCSGNNCNDFSLIPQTQTCAVCDSSSDVRCATDPTAIPTVQICTDLPRVDCYSRVKTDGLTARGCLSDLSESLKLSCLKGDTNCSLCLGNKCNSELFPEDRRICHKCNSLDDPNCQDAPSSPYVCPIYSASEICTSKIVDDVTYRGCGDDLICDDTDKQICKLCSTNNCNRANMYQNQIGYPGAWQGLPISCHTCFRDECWNETTTVLQQCKSDQENCVTVFSMMGVVVQRGCSDDIYSGFFDHHCDNHADLCKYCKSSGCNDAESLDDFVDCLFCDSATNRDCAMHPSSVAKTRKCQKCMTALYPQNDDVNPGYVLSRSCADDKEAADRLECESGNDSLCKICEESDCNTDLIPEERLSCWHCQGEDCEDPVQAECPIYKKNDRCYLLFGDGDNTVTQMGCASEFSDSDLAAIRKKMIFCNDDLCNYFDKVPVIRKCLVCDSSTDPLCATAPNGLTNIVSCTDFPHTSCYTKIEDGFTKRGCLSENTIEAIDVCLEQGDSAKCNVCDAEFCNKKIYPEDRRTCHRCSSNDDAICQGSPKDPSVCPIYKEDDDCVVHISGETTRRGCTSDFTCDTSDRDTCRICGEDGCNTVDLFSAFVGKPGQWQDLPLACYECKDASCQDSLGSLNSCKNNNLQNCMTVFDEKGEVLRRGCSDEVYDEYGEWCDAISGNCQLCKSSGCNDAQSIDAYVDCVFCDSSSNVDCVLNPADGLRTRKCKQQCMVALYPRTSDEDTAYELSRSCLDDKEAEDRDSCAAGDDSKCQSCTGASCNNFAFPAERHQCWTCKGSDDCENAKVQECVAYHPEDQCYILFDDSNSIVSMGCRSEMERAAVTNLIQTKNLLLCDGKNCNSYESIPQPQSCVVCHSATDPRCATNPNLIPNVQTCSLVPYTGCFTRINENGETERGCQADLLNEKFYECLTASDPKCDTCSGNNCNGDVFPANRLKCHRCNSTADANCAESPANNVICPVLWDDESCVASYQGGVTLRGCSYELSCDESNKKLCRVCSSAGCNTQNLEHVAKDGEPGKWQDLPISCFTCEGSACTDSPGSVESCANNNVQNCMTVFGADGVVVQRGCSDAVTEAQETWCEQNLDKCYRCNSNECNKADSLDDYVECVTCDAASDGSCVTDPQAQKITRKCYKSCMTALYPRTAEEDPSYSTTRTCLDDKELEDRELCTSGTDEHCSACDSDKCNVEAFPTDRRSCYHCSGDGCQLPEQQACAGYRGNDKCFIMFDDANSVIEMGCKSDFTIAQAVSLIKSKKLFLCDEDNCNSYEAIPTSQQCKLCNSRTDSRCATDPVGLLSSTTCSRLPYTHCYSRVLSDGITERGCISSLESDEFYDCLTDESGSCKPCVGANCNKEVFPEGRRSCHICDSLDDPNCEANPASISICPIYVPEDTCVTSYVGGKTTRGCGSSVECEANSRRSCRVCSSEDACNTIDLASLWDDNFGKWQDLPLSCYECEGADCQNELGEATTCALNNEQDCSTVFNEDGEVIARGCSDLVEVRCQSNPELCFNCKSNYCNTANATTEFTKCHYCDSNKDKNCVLNPLTSTFKSRQCQGGCMVALYEATSGSNPTYDLIRTCLNDKEVADQETCALGEEAFCKACTGDGCNTDDLPEDRLRCYTCSGDDCEIPKSAICPIYKENDQCYVRFDETNSVSEMGCLSEFRSQEIEDILKTKRVYICDGENCNELEALPSHTQCAVCDSANDINCAVNPSLIGTINTCYMMPYTDCYTKISSTGTTVRGCLADLEANEFVKCILSGGDDCSRCTANGCNKEVFPESRLRCHTCSSDSDPDCETLPSALEICPYVKASEKCTTAIDGNATVRGCSSEILCDANNRSICRLCGLHGCNTVDLVNRVVDTNHGMWQDLPLRCHDCSGDHCLNSLGPAQACTGGDNQDCVTVFNGTDEVIRRGCQYDVEDDLDLYCRENPKKCLICKSNECNDAWELSDFIDCIACDSATDSTCASNPTKDDFPTRKCQKGCMVASYTAANDTTQIIRTCLDDKELSTQFLCSFGFSELDCTSCTTSGCNNFNYPRNRMSCHVCQGDGCSILATEYCPVYESGDTCFAKFENGVVDLAGCSSSVDNTIMEGWKQENKIYSCNFRVCNEPSRLPTSRNCVSCDSSRDEKCATDPESITTSAHCLAPVNSCFSNITNSVTYRGCLQSLNSVQQTACKADYSVLCETCVGEKCNSEIYPSNRRRCHICDSNTDDGCKYSYGKDPSVCPRYQTKTNCVTKLSNGLVERGCSTDLSCDSKDDHCNICYTDGCNSENLGGGAHTLLANTYLLALLVAMISWIGLNSNQC